MLSESVRRSEGGAVLQLSLLGDLGREGRDKGEQTDWNIES